MALARSTGLSLREIIKYEPIALGLDVIFRGRALDAELLEYELRKRNLASLIPQSANSEFLKTVKLNSKSLVMRGRAILGASRAFQGPNGARAKPKS